MPNIGDTGGSKFLTFGIKKAFNQLKLLLTKVLVPQHFDLEYHIRIETNASSNAIGKVLSQQTLDYLGK